MKPLNLALAALLAIFCVATVPARPAPATKESRIQVGVFNSKALVLACYRSPMFADQINDLRKQKADALAQKDQKRADELEKQGAAMQDLAHRQLTGAAPIDNILDALKSALPRVAADAGVQIIPSSADVLLFRSEDVRNVDLTDALVRELKADEKTLQLIAEFLRKESK